MSVSKFFQCGEYLFDVRKQFSAPDKVKIVYRVFNQRLVSEGINVKSRCFQEALDLSRNRLPFSQPAHFNRYLLSNWSVCGLWPFVCYKTPCRQTKSTPSLELPKS